MVRFLTILTGLLSLLAAPGCMALQCQNSWSSCGRPCPPSAMCADPTPYWIAPQHAVLPFAPPTVVSAPPISTEAWPASPAADSAGRVTLASTSPSATPSTTVRLYYGTNRPALSQSAQPVGNRYGECEVSIPQRHQFGHLERPSFWRLEFRESEAKHVVLKQIHPLSPEECLGRIQGDLSHGNDAALFVFVHGYNVTFDEAARRTAQMAFDLQFRGVPLFYSWPSQGTLTGYSKDQASADASAAPLAEFLSRIATETGARRIHLVAHSLGNRALVGALARLGQSNPTSVKFNQVVFAAPDLDAAQFANDIAPRIQPVVERVTIYSSGSDLALWASRLWHRTTRLGQPGPYWPQIQSFEWIDVIDATSVGFEWFELGHSAYGGALLADLQRVLDGRPAGDPVAGPAQGRWRVTRPAPPPTLPGGFTPTPVFIYRPTTPWPVAPVDRWR